MAAAEELEAVNAPEAQKLREKRDKERQKERAKVEKEKEYDDGKFMFDKLVKWYNKHEDINLFYPGIKDAF